MLVRGMRSCRITGSTHERDDRHELAPVTRSIAGFAVLPTRLNRLRRAIGSTVFRAAPDVSVEAPMLSELFSVAQLEQHARAMAGWHKTDPRRQGRDGKLLQRLAENEIGSFGAQERLTASVGEGTRITHAAEWFLDNYHLIDEEIGLARRFLPPGYSRQLPRLIKRSNSGDSPCV